MGESIKKEEDWIQEEKNSKVQMEIQGSTKSWLGKDFKNTRSMIFGILFVNNDSR
jgi:hypothetical protein